MERLVLDLLHVRVDLAGRPTEDGEQRDEEHQQHPLEHERNRQERGRDGACDGCVVTLGHEHACGAVPEPDRHELAQHCAGGSVAGGRLLDRCPDLLTRQRGANRRRGVERRRAGAGRLRGGEPEAPTGVVQRRRLDVVDHDLLPEEPLQGASPGGRQLPLEVTGRELPGEHGLGDEPGVLLDGVARLGRDEPPHHHEDRHARDREAHTGEQREAQDEPRRSRSPSGPPTECHAALRRRTRRTRRSQPASARSSSGDASTAPLSAPPWWFGSWPLATPCPAQFPFPFAFPLPFPCPLP